MSLKEQQTLSSVNFSGPTCHAFYNSLLVVTVELFFHRDIGDLESPFTQTPPIAIRNVLPIRNLNSPQKPCFSHTYQQAQPHL